MTRVAVFIDYQNTYKGARSAFERDGHFVDGQVYPRRFGIAVTQLGRTHDPARELEFVRVFRGEPSSKHSPGGQAACQRQVRFWSAQERVTATTRPLKYSPIRDIGGRIVDWKAEEKGIDVLIALAMVTGAHADEYDVAVLMSADTDLVPALEQVVAAGKRVEVAAWSGKGHRPRLRVPGVGIWCHWLDAKWYERLHDPTDYTVDQGTPPADP